MANKSKQLKGCCGTPAIMESLEKKRKKRQIILLVCLGIIFALFNVGSFGYLRWQELSSHEFVCHSNTVIPNYYATDNPYCAFYYSSDDWTCKSNHGKGPVVTDAETIAIMGCELGTCDLWYTVIADIYKRKAYNTCFNITITDKDVAHIIADNYVHEISVWQYAKRRLGIK